MCVNARVSVLFVRCGRKLASYFSLYFSRMMMGNDDNTESLNMHVGIWGETEVGGGFISFTTSSIIHHDAHFRHT